jgi:hypothetical protein
LVPRSRRLKDWTLVKPSRLIRQRAWYYSTITVNPTNADDLYFPQVPLLRSIDGGKTLHEVKGLHHGDHHDCGLIRRIPNG